jgi:hypothetical protein
VGVIVGLQHVGYRQALVASDLQVEDIDVPARIDDNRLTAVSRHVRATAEVAKQSLPEEQDRSFPENFTERVMNGMDQVLQNVNSQNPDGVQPVYRPD